MKSELSRERRKKEKSYWKQRSKNQLYINRNEGKASDNLGQKKEQRSLGEGSRQGGDQSRQTRDVIRTDERTTTRNGAAKPKPDQTSRQKLRCGAADHRRVGLKRTLAGQHRSAISCQLPDLFFCYFFIGICVGSVNNRRQVIRQGPEGPGVTLILSTRDTQLLQQRILVVLVEPAAEPEPLELTEKERVREAVGRWGPEGQKPDRPFGNLFTFKLSGVIKVNRHPEVPPTPDLSLGWAGSCRPASLHPCLSF